MELMQARALRTGKLHRKKAVATGRMADESSAKNVVGIIIRFAQVRKTKPVTGASFML